MSLKFAVLGLIAERRGYGYEIHHRLLTRMGPSWHLPAGAVYGALDRLEQDGLAAAAGAVSRCAGSGRAAPRVMYEATSAGVEEFERWMSSAPKLEPVRAEIFLRLAVSRSQHAAALDEALASFEQACLDELAAQSEVQLPNDPSADVPLEMAASWLVHSGTIARLDTDRRWAQGARRALAAAASAGTVPLAQLVTPVAVNS